jgi:hypothetical protein
MRAAWGVRGRPSGGRGLAGTMAGAGVRGGVGAVGASTAQASVTRDGLVGKHTRSHFASALALLFSPALLPKHLPRQIKQS